MPASPWAWRCLGTLTFRSAGNSSFFTSPVAAAMLPAPENAASPSWDACSFAFSATARAGGAHQCPPCQKGYPAVASCPAPPTGGAGREMLAGSSSSQFLALVGRGGGHGTALQLGKECEQPPQILVCQPCYIRGFSRVTSAPQLASDLVSVATFSGTEQYPGRMTEGPYLRLHLGPHLGFCSLGVERDRDQVRGTDSWAPICAMPRPWQGSEPGQQPVHTPCQGTWGLSTCLAPLKAPVVPAGARTGAAQGHRHVPGRAGTPGPSTVSGHSQAGRMRAMLLRKTFHRIQT